MKTTLWIVQALLALAFLMAGGMKLFAYERYKAMSEKNGPSGLTRGLTTFIGVAEVAGALGVVLPMATGIAPWLSALGRGRSGRDHAAGCWLPVAPPRAANRPGRSICASFVRRSRPDRFLIVEKSPISLNENVWEMVGIYLAHHVGVSLREIEACRPARPNGV